MAAQTDATRYASLLTTYKDLPRDHAASFALAPVLAILAASAGVTSAQAMTDREQAGTVTIV